jgi:uncharacterized membrane-anchored protein YjiN (DUF445 family)
MPATFFAASAACIYDFTRAPAILFFIIGCTFVCYGSVMSYFLEPAFEGLAKALTDSMIYFAESDEQTEKLLDALAISLDRALNSSSLQQILKKTFIDSLGDDELHDAAIRTINKALKKAAENEEFHETFFDVIKRAFVGALNNESFISESMNSGVAAMVRASQDEVLRQNMLSVVTQAVSDALNDDEFLDQIKSVIKTCLEDEDFFKSGARGIMKAANPFGGRKKSDGEKPDSSIKQLSSERL